MGREGPRERYGGISAGGSGGREGEMAIRRAGFVCWCEGESWDPFSLSLEKGHVQAPLVPKC